MAKRDYQDPPIATADRVLPVASRLFREKGYSAATTRELAELLGLNKATLYYHAEKKEDLLYRICMQALDTVRSAVNKRLEGLSDPVDRLKALIAAQIESMTDDVDMHATMLLELRALSPDRRREVVAIRESHAVMVQEMISDAQAAGQFRTDIDAKSLSILLFNLMNWTLTWYRADGSVSRTDLVEHTIALFLDGARVRR